MGVDDVPLADLPGPRKFFKRIERDLSVGRSVVVVLPDDALVSGLGRRVYEGLSESTNIAVDSLDLAGGETPIPVAVARKSFYNPELIFDSDSWRSYLAHDEAQRRSVLVASWDAPLGDDLTYWLNLVHSASMDRAERPTFLFVVRIGDVDIDSVERADSDDVSIWWWWGVVGLIDTELTIEFLNEDGPCHPMRRAMVAEVVGWELEAVPSVMSAWATTPAELSRVVRGDGSEVGRKRGSGVDEALHSRPPARRPSRALVFLWSSGHLNLWNGQYHFKCSTNLDTENERRFWNAQARVLMPILEQERAKFADQFQKIATRAVIQKTQSESDLLELGPMAWAHRDKLVRIKHYSHLVDLVRIRNKIAHNEPIDGDLYAKACAMTAIAS